MKLVKEEHLSTIFSLEGCYSTPIISLWTVDDKTKYDTINYRQFLQTHYQVKEYWHDEDQLT